MNSDMTDKRCILFAAPIGSSKTPIATYLSSMLGLAIHNNDAIRTEVLEDGAEDFETEYLKRRDERIHAVLASGIPFILDASIDRRWEELRPKLDEAGYRYFIISLDFSPELLDRIYRHKSYQDLENLKKTIADHEEFLAKHGSEIDLHLTDAEFRDRLKLSAEAVRRWIEG